MDREAKQRLAEPLLAAPRAKCAPRQTCLLLEPEVRERLVGIGHAMDFLALLHGATTTFGSLD
ncbi:hypothetical protein SBBP2_1350006 [Burkholderiales bacterium]|nr:hypothetical protein SBBP2_1350006 [Burkholderiales bacterium]